MHQSRVTLTPAGTATLRRRLAREDRLYAEHQLIWTLFPGQPRNSGEDDDHARPFLYHVVERDPFTAIIRSAIPPEAAGDHWTVEPQPFAPVLSAGDRLLFRLRAVATSARREAAADGQPRGRGKPQDVVVAAWWAIQPEERRQRLSFADLAPLAGYEWLARQGGRNGFAVVEEEVIVQSYEPQSVRKPGSARPLTFGALAMAGWLTVTDADAFTGCLHRGLGRAKGFGYGLLHVARDSAA